MSRIFHLIALAVAAAAIVAPIAQAETTEAEGFLRLAGMPPSQIESWTKGACSYAVKPSSCYLTPAEATLASQRTAEGFLAPYGGKAVPVDQSLASQRTAEGFLRLAGMSPSQIEAWTKGACSYAVKPSSCYLTPAETRLASQRTAEGFLALAGYAAPSQETVARPGGFDWGDAGIGAGAALGVALLVAGLGAMLVVSRHHRRPPIVHA